MIRLLLILAAVLLLPGLSAQAGLWAQASESPAGQSLTAALEELVDADCCPDDCCPDDSMTGEDCCDGGACACSPGIVASLSDRVVAEPDSLDTPLPGDPVRLPLHLLQPRDNGPPEHPPPIA